MQSSLPGRLPELPLRQARTIHTVCLLHSPSSIPSQLPSSTPSPERCLSAVAAIRPRWSCSSDHSGSRQSNAIRLPRRAKQTLKGLTRRGRPHASVAPSSGCPTHHARKNSQLRGLPQSRGETSTASGVCRARAGRVCSADDHASDVWKRDQPVGRSAVCSPALREDRADLHLPPTTSELQNPQLHTGNPTGSDCEH